MTTEIFLEGNRLDITADISSLLTFAIDDVKDFGSRQTTFSKAVTLPGTGRNNRILGHIFELGSANDYDPDLPNSGYNFNASKSAAALMFQDNLQTFKGTLRLIQINKDRGVIEYEVALNGDLTTLNVALSSGFLTDLDFSAYDLTWTTAHIKASWDNPGGSGVYFPLVDYGTYGRYLGSDGKHDWDFRTFRPALYVKEYIDKMFAAAGFRYDCTLFGTPRFKSLIIPHNQKQITKPTASILSGGGATNQHIINHTASVNNGNVEFTGAVGGLFTIAGDKIFTYTGGTTINVTLNIHIEGHYVFQNIGGVPFNLKMTVQKNGVDYYYDGIPINTNTGFDAFYTRDYAITMTLSTGDSFNVRDFLQGGPAGPADVFVDVATLSVISTSIITAPLDYGELIEIKYSIPQNIRQVDFLTSIVKLFNLYVYEDRFDDLLIFMAPFVDYYSTDSRNADDWTYKLNRDQVIKIKPLSEINSKTYNFNYKDDNDYYNELYKKRYNQGYGSYIFDTEFEFASQNNKLELVFAPTPLVGYVGEEKVYPTIFRRSGPDYAAKEENIDSVIRIMQSKKIIGVTSWAFYNDINVIDSTTDYGYAGHFDDPDAPSNDLNFGVLKELFFQLITGDVTVTQFNVYWSSYLAEICDKDSKMLIGKFYLTPKDIASLDFSKYKYVDGVLFRLNKITDYNTTIPSDCEVQLLKVIQTIY